MKSYPHIKKAFETTKIKKIGNYPYPVSPFAEINQINSEILYEVVQAAKKEKIFKKAELMLTFESAGERLAAAIGHELQLQYIVARKKSLHLSNEISFNVITNFDEKTFYLYGNFANKNIIIVDDVISSGETLKNAALALEKAGANVLAFFTVAAKTNLIGRKYEEILSDVQIPLISLIKIKVANDKVIIF